MERGHGPILRECESGGGLMHQDEILGLGALLEEGKSGILPLWPDGFARKTHLQQI